WSPDASPVDALHVNAGSWMLMLHGAAFGTYDHQNGFRGQASAQLIDWEMLMATRSVAGGLLRIDAMTSLEAMTMPKRGYPELLQTGGSLGNYRIVNAQHPNDLVMEFGAAFDHALAGPIAGSVYVAAVGQPALGPVAYVHRASSIDDPFAPI